jgi:hypothetical protein
MRARKRAAFGYKRVKVRGVYSVVAQRAYSVKPLVVRQQKQYIRLIWLAIFIRRIQHIVILHKNVGKETRSFN